MNVGRIPSRPYSSPLVGSARFPATSWSLLVQASAHTGQPHAAVAEFAQRYYLAVLGFISALAWRNADAEELTQEFFATVILSGRLLTRASPAKGSFRPFLKKAIRNFLIDEHRRRTRKAKSPGDQHITPDALEGGWDLIPDEASEKPDAELLKGWGHGLVNLALAKVEEICKKKGQEQHFLLFTRRFLSESDAFPGWREVGEPFNLSEKDARTRTVVVIRRFRDALRELIATDLGHERDVDQEIRDLIGLL